MNRQEWQKVYTPTGDGLNIRVSNALYALKETPRRTVPARRIAALAMAAVLMVTAALASRGLFSDEYDVIRLANRALAQEYGITEEMQTYFRKTVHEEDGVTTITYTGLQDMEHVLGVYTIVIENGAVQVTWSHDGDATDGGLDAHAWGAEQIEILLEMAKEDGSFARGYQKAQEIRMQMDADCVEVSITQADDKAVIVALDDTTYSGVIAVSEEQAIDIAKRAFAEEYGLTQAQLDMMQYEKDYAGYTYAVKDGRTICEVWFWLHQEDGVFHTDGDGLYWAQVNAQTGVIEAMAYDSALAGNG